MFTHNDQGFGIVVLGLESVYYDLACSCQPYLSHYDCIAGAAMEKKCAGTWEQVFFSFFGDCCSLTFDSKFPCSSFVVDNFICRNKNFKSIFVS
jgi:hypothetical protein